VIEIFLGIAVFAWVVWVAAWIINASNIHEARSSGRYFTRRF
jgi:hypothetical protein